VADAMHRGILICEPDATINEVARMMATHHVHCLAVVGTSHEEPECFVWGIISDVDLLAWGICNKRGATARDLADQPLIAVTPMMPLCDAGQLMLTYGVTHLVVIDPETQLADGILSTLDIAGVMARGEV
jgi:CBS domain-containing protein